MDEILGLVQALLTGVVLGVIFFGGLWWTIEKAITSRQPARWLLCSKLLRTSIALTGFYFVSNGRWTSLSTCLAGFVLGRLLVIRRTRLDELPREFVREVGHAPQP